MGKDIRNPSQKCHGAKSANQFPVGEKLFRDIIGSIQDGITVLDRDLNISFVNPVIEQWYQNRMPLVGKKCYLAYQNRTEPCEGCPSLRTLNSNKKDIAIIPFPSPEKKHLWLEILTFPLLNSRSLQTTGILELARDITERREAEQSIHESEALFRSLTDTTSSGIFIYQGEKFCYVNPTMISLTGYSREELFAMNFWDIIHPAFRDLAKQRGLARQKNIPVLPRYELKIITKSGQERWADISMTLTQFHGKPAGLGTAFDISERKMLEEDLRSLSLFDELTGLYNRRGFFTLAEQQLKVADRMKREMFLLFIDFDGLKSINDTFGHNEGSQALIDTANIMRETFRESDILGRIGGDEFVVLAIESTDFDIVLFKKRLQNAANSFNSKGSRRFLISLSAGVARYAPDSHYSLKDLIAHADSLMYEEKRSKKKQDV
ncbi:MAG: diguanylate cyclase [Thermodesulfovibrionales bacterium]|nr:diguanylate cyclase [Thermodesulfovibrionales bacterium]